MRAGRKVANGSNKKVFMHRSFRHIVALAALYLLVLPLAHAQLTIEIVGGAGTAVPIAIVRPVTNIGE